MNIHKDVGLLEPRVLPPSLFLLYYLGTTLTPLLAVVMFKSSALLSY
jgi:hypothetical protein